MQCNGKVFRANEWVMTHFELFLYIFPDLFDFQSCSVKTSDWCGVSKQRVKIVVKQRGLETASEKKPGDNHCCRSEL